MRSFFKHMAARIWLTVIFGGLASLWLLPSVQGRIGLEWVLVPVAFIILTAFLLCGWASNRWGVSTVERLLREASVFERDGMVAEAEAAFRRAVAVFDSFLISPLVKKQRAGELTARVARFYLARARKSYDSEAFLVSYLHANPGDEEVAENWIQQIESRGGLQEEHQELAHRIGNAHPQNRSIQSTLARYYLLLERTDFPALQTYRRVMMVDHQMSGEFIDDLAHLLLREKRTDDWALKIYLQAIDESPLQPELLSAIAACVRWIPLTEHNKSLLQKADTYLQGIDAAEIKKMSAGFKPPVPLGDVMVVGRKARRKASLLQTTGAVLQTFYEDMMALPKWIFRRALSVSRLAQQSKQTRRVLAGVLVVGLSGAVLALVINTVGHLVKSEKPVEKKVATAPQIITDPFTLQVAAYLKPAHAKKYVEQLKKLGLDAYWREAISANKKWYQVRVSHFPDKKSARDFGESLKARGIIDDFYVANYVAPQ